MTSGEPGCVRSDDPSADETVLVVASIISSSRDPLNDTCVLDEPPAAAATPPPLARLLKDADELTTCAWWPWWPAVPEDRPRSTITTMTASRMRRSTMASSTPMMGNRRSMGFELEASSVVVAASCFSAG